MGTVVNLIAVLVAIGSVLAALGNAAYLGLLSSAATKRAGGAPIAAYVRSRWPMAAGTTAGALLALLLAATGNVPVDVLAVLVGAGSGAAATKALRSTQQRYRSGS